MTKALIENDDYAHVCVVPNTGSKSTWYMCSAGSPGEENEKEGGESRSTEGGEKLVSYRLSPDSI
jgi:hypothetical protein